MLRLVVDDEGQIWPDFSAKLPGRGVYFCMGDDCLRSLSDKRLQVLRRDFLPHLPQSQVLRERLSVMLGFRIEQLMLTMKRRSAVGRDAVMHQMWKKEPLLVLFASDAGEALVRQVQDAVEKRSKGKVSFPLSAQVLVSLLDAKALGLALGRDKVSVVAFFWNKQAEKFQQLCVWQKSLMQVSGADIEKGSKVTDVE